MRGGNGRSDGDDRPSPSAHLHDGIGASVRTVGTPSGMGACHIVRGMACAARAGAARRRPCHRGRSLDCCAPWSIRASYCAARRQRMRHARRAHVGRAPGAGAAWRRCAPCDDRQDDRQVVGEQASCACTASADARRDPHARAADVAVRQEDVAPRHAPRPMAAFVRVRRDGAAMSDVAPSLWAYGLTMHWCAPLDPAPRCVFQLVFGERRRCGRRRGAMRSR